MSMNSFGHLFAISTFGESHGEGVGVVVDGVPPGIHISEEDIQIELDRRRPGQSSLTTPRKEADAVKIYSGVFEGKTTGTPIMLLIHNTNVRSQDYGNIQDKYRPMHADYTYDSRYGFRDYRGGGRSSARETVGRVAAGAIARKALKEICGMEIIGHVKQVGKIVSTEFHPEVIEQNPVRAADLKAAKQMEELIEKMKPALDSVGGVVEVVARNVPAGLGSPTYWKIKSDFAHALMGINAVQGVEYGSGFHGASMTGSEHNDEFYFDEATQRVRTKSNNHGGILGGITSGEDVVLRAAFKPVSSLPREQDSVNRQNENIKIQTFGRHEKAMVAIVMLDHWLISQAYKHHIDIAAKEVGVVVPPEPSAPSSSASPSPAPFTRTVISAETPVKKEGEGVCPLHNPKIVVPVVGALVVAGLVGYYLGKTSTK